MADPVTIGFPRLRQRVTAAALNGTATPNVNWKYECEADNALIAIVGSGADDITTPSGWTLLADGNLTSPESDRVKIFGKIADGTETAFSATVSSSNENALTLLEFEGPYTGITDINDIVDFSWDGPKQTATAYNFDPVNIPAQAANVIIAAILARNANGTGLFSNWSDANYHFFERADLPLSSKQLGVATALTDNQDAIDLSVSSISSVSAGCLVVLKAPAGYVAHGDTPNGTGTWKEGGTAGNSATLANVDPEADPVVNPNHPAASPWRGTGGQAKIIEAWNGAYLRHTASITQLIKETLGGHSDYAGTEQYTFNARNVVPTEAWSRTRDPIATGISNDNLTNGVNADAATTPRSRHCYAAGPIYDWDDDQVLWPGGSALYGPDAPTTAVFSRMLFSNPGVFVYDYANVPSVGQITHAHYIHNQRVVVFGDNSANFAVFDKQANTWEQVDNGLAATNPTEGCSCYDSKRNWIIVTGQHVSNITIYDIGALRAYTIATTNPPSNLDDAICGIAYDEYTDTVVAWNGSGTGLFDLNLTSFNWSARTINGTQTVTPANATVNGVFGAFRYIPPISGLYPEGAFILAPQTINGSTYLFSVESETPTIISVTDSASGSDEVGSISVGLSVSDTATGTDNPPAPNVSFSLSDTASGNDQQSIAAQMGITDSGNAIDQQAISAQLSVTDSATGNDAQSIAVTLTINDSATGIDTPAIIVSLSVTDTGAGSDAVSLTGSTLITINDIATALDAVASVTVGAQVSDTGAAVDQVNIAASLTVTDLGAGNDVVNVVTQLIKTILDSATANDSIAITASLQISDTALGSDTLAIANLLQVIDSAQGIDAVVQFDTTSRITTITFKLLKRRIKFQLLQ